MDEQNRDEPPQPKAGEGHEAQAGQHLGQALTVTLQSRAIFAANFLLILYLQDVCGYTPLTAARVILLMPLISAVVGPLSGLG